MLEGEIVAEQTQPPTKDTTKSQKEESDEALARYTLWLMVFAGVLAFATIGLGIATLLLYATGEKQFKFAVRSGSRQSRDMRSSIAAANRSAQAAERALTDLERPWIFIFNVTRPVLIPGTTNFRLHYRVANFGKIPALIEAARISFVFEDAGADPSGGYLSTVG